MSAMDYANFVARKILACPSVGFEVDELNPQLYPFQADLTRWALRRGRAALFCDCGMGKTPMQLEWAHRVAEESGGQVLILAPLAVAQQTVREAQKFGIRAAYCRSHDGISEAITVANYEMLDHFDPGDFAGIVLDESSILKAYDGKTRTAIIDAFQSTPYRLACTATPAPNDFMELGNHSEFLGVMTRAEMLAMFFVHDGGATQEWRVKGHAESEFWRWVCSWGAMIRRPSDLGYDDGAFILPSLDVVETVVAANHAAAAREAGTLFFDQAQTLQEQRAARRASLDARVAECARLANARDDQWLVWCELNDEGNALERAIRGAVQVQGSDTNEHKADSMLGFAERRIRVLVTKPSIAGFGMNWQNCHNVAFVGVSHSYEQFYQAVRRCWRFGQASPVECHVIIAETEGRVVANLRRKEADAGKMADAMALHMRDLQRREVAGARRDTTNYIANVPMTIPSWVDSESA